MPTVSAPRTRMWRRLAVAAITALALVVCVAGANAATVSAQSATRAAAPPPLNLGSVPANNVQTLLDAHTNQSVVVNGTGFGPQTATPNSGSCAQAPAQSATFDRTKLSDAQLAYYGLPPRPKGKSATKQHLATWTNIVTHQKLRVCTGRALFDPTTGKPISFDTNYHYAGNIDKNSSYEFTDVYATVGVACLSPNSDYDTYSGFWTGIGADGGLFSELKQGGTAQNVDSRGNDVYHVWSESVPYQQSAIYHFGVWCGDQIFLETYGQNCQYIYDNRNGESNTDCSGPAATWTDADFIVERPPVSGADSYLADFGWMNFIGTGTNVGDPESLDHFGIWMQNNGHACASPGSWTSDYFKVTWNGYCN